MTSLLPTSCTLCSKGVTYYLTFFENTWWPWTVSGAGFVVLFFFSGKNRIQKSYSHIISKDKDAFSESMVTMFISNLYNGGSHKPNHTPQFTDIVISYRLNIHSMFFFIFFFATCIKAGGGVAECTFASIYLYD